MKKFFIILILLPLLSLKSFANSPLDDLYRQFNVEELIEIIPEQTAEISENMLSDDISIENLISLTPYQLYKVVKEQALKYISQYRLELFSIISAVLIMALFGGIWEIEKQNEIYDLICVISITAITVRPILNCISHCCNSIRDITKFMTAYIPIYASVMTASGSVSAAAFYQTIVFAASQIINQLSVSFFMPILHGYMLLSLTGSISKNSGIIGLCDGIKKLITWSLTLISTTFTAILSFQSIYGSATDSAFSKTAKFLVGSFVPIIGSAFADAVSAVNGSIKIIRAAVGGLGIAVATIGFLPVLINITILRIILWFTKMIGDSLTVNQIKNLISGFSNVLSIVMALVLTSIMLLVISTAIMMTTAAI